MATAPTLEDAVAHRCHQTPGNALGALGCAILQHHAELVRREPADAVLVAQGAAEPAPDDRDHLIADIEAIGLVDQRQIVDRDQQEGAIARSAAGIGEERRKLLGQPRPVELAGQFIMAAEKA